MTRLRERQRLAESYFAAGQLLGPAISTDALADRNLVRSLLVEMASAMRRTRSVGIRMLIDTEGASLTQASRILGHPRQVVKRLYDRSEEEARGLGAPNPEEPADAQRPGILMTKSFEGLVENLVDNVRSDLCAMVHEVLAGVSGNAIHAPVRVDIVADSSHLVLRVAAA
jgi:hypothetical protein